MSTWSNFKKNISRATDGVLKGDGSFANSPELYEQIQRFENLKKKADRLLLEAKNFLQSIRNVSMAQKDLASNLVIPSDGPKSLTKDQVHFKDASSELATNVFLHFEEAFNHTVIMPIDKYCRYLPTFDAAITRCKHRLIDLEKARSQQVKIVDKNPSDNSLAAQANDAIDYAENVYETLKLSLITEIPKLINARVYVIEPAFKSLIKLQLEFFKKCLETLTPPHDYTAPPPSGSEDPIDTKMNNIIQQIRDLSVCNLPV
ncbi:Protein hob3 [Smittium mucronatum]|uniref:Protein hob3 n=1 Tax=Smittium mucronatum TaxID=133383 RepID=A0A1R0H7V6_9FUNG|nr:Protein hob3 [Smittium mucronatum]